MPFVFINRLRIVLRSQHVSGAENGAERAKIGWSGAERGAGVAENDGAGQLFAVCGESGDRSSS